MDFRYIFLYKDNYNDFKEEVMDFRKIKERWRRLEKMFMRRV